MCKKFIDNISAPKGVSERIGDWLCRVGLNLVFDSFFLLISPLLFQIPQAPAQRANGAERSVASEGVTGGSAVGRGA